MKSRVDKSLVSNTFFLYLLTFSSQLFSLITVPYLTRVLGPVTYGKNGIALAYMSYVTLIMDLGFILSATQKVVANRSDKKYLGKLFFSVTLVKSIVGLGLTILFGLYVWLTPSLRTDFAFYITYLFAYIVNAYFPDFYYRGIEQMKIITYRTLAIKMVFTALVFITVRSEADLLMIPISTLIGNIVALVAIYIDIIRVHHIRFVRPSLQELQVIVRDTIPFFVSRIASTVYQALNTIILGFVYGTSAIVGYYTSADKIVSVSKTCSSPIADSLYPYMLRKKNYSLIKKLMLLVMPLICLAGVILFIFAEDACVLLFGQEYAPAGNILRCLIPIMVVILPTYILCFPVMVPLGLSNYANMSNVVGMVLQIIGLIILTFTSHLDVYSLCVLTSISEVSVFIFRLCVVVLHCKRSKTRRIKSIQHP